MKKKWAEQGFSLMQGMMLAGVLAGTSLVATKLIQDQKLALKAAETRDQVEQVHRLIYSTLQDRDNCKATQPTLPTGVITLSTVVDRNNKEVVAAGKKYMNDNVLVASMKLTPNAAGTQATLEVEYERLNNSSAKRLKEGYGAKNIKKTISLRLQRDPKDLTRPYSGCYAMTGENTAAGESGNEDLNKKLCEELNSTGDTTTNSSMFMWDESTGSCRPRQNVCPPGELNTGINSNGVVECRAISDWMDTTKLFDPSNPSGSCPAGKSNVRIDNSTGKIRIICY